MKIYDCFKFNGEWDILNIRLNTHASEVDHFVIAEGNHTQVGNKKPFLFDFNHPVVQPHLHKIRYIHVTDMPNTQNPWDNEKHLRDALVRALWDAQDVDWVLVGDCDEIVRPECLRELKSCTVKSVGFEQTFYYCYFNNMQTQPLPHIWSKAGRYELLKASCMQNLRHAPVEQVMNQAGWHYSYMMSKDDIICKLQNIADTWVNNPVLIQHLDPEACAQHGCDLLGRTNQKWQLVEETQVDMPVFVKQNRQIFDRYFLKPDPQFSRPRPRFLMHYAQEVPGWFMQQDFEFYKWCVMHHASPAHFVEVGSFKGRSSAYMAVEIINSQKQIKFDCVDTWEGSHEHQLGGEAQDTDVVAHTLFDRFLENMQPVQGYYQAVRMNSVTAAQTYPDESLDLVFLDASHDEHNVILDIQAWLPKVKKGGMLSGHDWHMHSVQQAVSHMLTGFYVHGICWYYFKA